MSENVRFGRTLGRFLPLILGLLLVAALGIGAVVVQAQAQDAPPEELTEEELLRRMVDAPANAPDYTASVSIEQTLVPEGLLGAPRGDGGNPDSGPRTARIWYGGPEQVRAELQGQNGDTIFVRNGSEVGVYDGATNTLKTGQKPESDAPPERPEDVADPEKFEEFLAKISPTSNLGTGPPVRVANRWAYPLVLEPKDKSLTLVERAEAFVDAETFVPLSFELYAESAVEPVVRYEVSNFQVAGSGLGERYFELEAPPGAQVEPFEPREDGDRAENRDENREPSRVASVAEARELVGFPVKQLAAAPGGRELEEIRVAGSEGVTLIYGSGWETVILAQRPESADEPRSSEESQDENGPEEMQVPTVDLGGDVEAKEISTPIGTGLSWSADGVSYFLAGSVPAAELEEAARGIR